MSELEAKLEQNKVNQRRLKEEETRLLEEIEKEKEVKWKFGDIAVFSHELADKNRYLLYDKHGNLRWFATEKKYNCPIDYNISYVTHAKIFKYRKVGSLFTG